MFSIQNLMMTKCNLYEKLPIQSVRYEMLPRQNVTIRKCTIQNVTNHWGLKINHSAGI